jgi:hypothetical protein
MRARRGGKRDGLIRAFGLAFGPLSVGAALAVAGLLHDDRVSSLSVIVLVAAAMSGVLYEADAGTTGVSASFLVFALAAALLGKRTKLKRS